MAGPVHGLMAARGVVILRASKSLIVRQLNDVRARHVEGLGAAMAHHGAGGLEEGIRFCDPLIGIGRGGDLRIIVRGQAIDLFDIEDSVALQKGDVAFDILAGPFISFGPVDGRGVDDGSAFFALAHAAPEGERLLEGHPERGAIAALGGGGPEDEDIDPGISLARVAKRPGDGSGGVSGGPGLGPGFDAGFEAGDDLVGDPAIDVRAVVFLGHDTLLSLWSLRTRRRRGGGGQPRRSPERDTANTVCAAPVRAGR